MNAKWILNGLALMVCLLMTAACGSVPSHTQEHSGSSDSTAASSSVPQISEEDSTAEEIKCVDVYDNTPYQGQLTIRFLGLDELAANNGEAALLMFPDGTNLLVDTHREENASQLENMLKKSGVNRIDRLLLTHYHNDHTGGFHHLLETFEIGQVYLPDFPDYRGEEDEEIFKQLEEKQIPWSFAKKGDEIVVGEDVHIEILNPAGTITYPEDMTDKKQKSALENNHSIVFLLTYGQTKALFTGDIYAEQERILLNEYGEKLQCQLLKVPHHGLSTSSSTMFLLSVQPEFSVMMGGQPSMNIYDSLKGRSEAYATISRGTVLAVSDGTSFTIIPEHEDTTNGVYG